MRSSEAPRKYTKQEKSPSSAYNEIGRKVIGVFSKRRDLPNLLDLPDSPTAEAAMRYHRWYRKNRSSPRVTLYNLTHTFPDDLDILLVSPTGQNSS